MLCRSKAETSVQTLGPATSEADAFGAGRCVFAAAATFAAPRDIFVTVTILSDAGEREDAVTVGPLLSSPQSSRYIYTTASAPRRPQGCM